MVKVGTYHSYTSPKLSDGIAVADVIRSELLGDLPKTTTLLPQIEINEPQRLESSLYLLQLLSNETRRDIWFHTSEVGEHSLLVPEGYICGANIIVRIQEDDNGTFLATSEGVTMYGLGESVASAFEDFRTSLRNHFLSLVRDETCSGPNS